MSTKIRPHVLNGMNHTAGIFSDMSIDGPEIGTLVIIVDRAKNLPNRKTIGKQDPYCAARLGKEAKKTTTDIRGGQTPRWDQELRFTVHDSPDYYQLKVSVFNDDKKTDLIGEAWVDLRDIIVAGGGQNDLWHNLTCRGKYAGEIRIEITFYDSRPKPEKPAAKPKPVHSDTDAAPAPVTGATAPHQRSPPKRRPLPSDPVTGHPAAAPAPAPAPVPAPSQPPAVAAGRHAPAHVQTPPRPQPNPPSSYIPNQSPLQAVEYNTPPPQTRYHQPDNYSPAPPSGSKYGTPMHNRADASPQSYRSVERHDKFAANYPEDHDYPDYSSHGPEGHDPRLTYGAAPDHQAILARDDRWAAPEEDRPPPPPAHRTRNNSGSTHDLTVYQNSYDAPAQNPALPVMRKDVLRSEAHRYSISSDSYPGKPTYRAYDPAASSSSTALTYANEAHHQPSSPQHHSYDAAYDPHHRSMQPTVEDVPDSPSPVDPYRRRSGARASQYEEPKYIQNPSPAPLSLGQRGNAAPGQYSPSPASGTHRHQGSYDYAPSPSSMPGRDYTSASAPQASYGSYNAPNQRHASHRPELDGVQPESPARYSLPAPPPVPSSLVPGIDPDLSQEIALRINEGRRHERRYTQPPAATPPRGRQPVDDYPPEYASGQASGSVQPFITPRQSYEGSPVSYSAEPSTQMVKSRAISPSPSSATHHTIRRKSISPAPPVEGRRLSGVPFGPDSYDALNPTLASSAPKDASHPDYNEVNGKIITHDGKEVDPSDHLPMESWAPEPEPKQKPPAGQPAASRPSPAGAQPMPASGRRTLRITARPHSTQALPPPPPSLASSNSMGSPLPPSTARNRLQKKANRASAAPVMAEGMEGSSPLAPLSHYQETPTPPRQLPRANTFDYPNENHAPMYGSSPGGRGGSASAPPVPAKVPLVSGALVPAGGPRSGADGEWALMEEMSRIDIGTGRARRHGHRGY